MTVFPSLVPSSNPRKTEGKGKKKRRRRKAYDERLKNLLRLFSYEATRQKEGEKKKEKVIRKKNDLGSGGWAQGKKKKKEKGKESGRPTEDPGTLYLLHRTTGFSFARKRREKKVKERKRDSNDPGTSIVFILYRCYNRIQYYLKRKKEKKKRGGGGKRTLNSYSKQ